MLHDLIKIRAKENLAKTRPEIHGELLEAYRAWAAESTEETRLLPYRLAMRMAHGGSKGAEMEIYPGWAKGSLQREAGICPSVD